MKKRLKAVICTAVIIGGVFILTHAFAKQPSPRKDDLYDQIELLAASIGVIRNGYVEEVNSRDLIYGALKGMLSSLDSHSQFLDPEDYDEMKVETQGRFGGIGVEVTMKDGMPCVITPIEDTPAFKAGLKPNDSIVSIDGKPTRDLALDEVVKLLRGDPGTVVTVTVLREQEKQLQTFPITRAMINIKSIKEASLLKDKIGYIKLVEFQENTPKDFIKALKDLRAKGASGVILDLRNNPGGLLDTAVRVSEVFLPAGALVVSTKGRAKEQNTVYRSEYKNPMIEMPLVILVNEGSASASEIVAAAVRDNKRGIVLGQKTFGKGSVQTVIPLGDGSAIRLTTARYFTPAGQPIHDEGVMPDIVVDNPDGGDRQLQTALSLITCLKAYEPLKTPQPQP
jgi:carboxyl-terminal processing protease